MGRGVRGMGEKGEGITKYKLVVTERSWYSLAPCTVKYSIGNRVAKEHT